MPTTAAIILAAGMGTRMKSATAKVLHRVAGRTLLAHILAALDGVDLAQVIVVVGHQGDDVEVEARAVNATVDVVEQAEQRGTGHAVQTALPAVRQDVDRLLVLPGDTPLLTPATLRALVSATSPAGALLTTRLEDPTGYGRVVRDDGGRPVRVVEQTDASEEELAIDEVNAGMYCVDRALLAAAVASLDDANAQGELYLTDLVAHAADEGRHLDAIVVDAADVQGINDRAQLADAGAALNRRHLDDLMRSGVTIVDPATTRIDVTVAVEADATILPGCLLEGTTTVASGSVVGPYSHLRDTTVGVGATVRFAVTDGATIGESANVGPYTYLRPGTVLARGAKAGGFVEMKAAEVGEGSKVPHLSYIGDATIGRDVNVGAGTITCNYDGHDKHRTEIGDGAFIGSDTMLVAPVRIGRGAVTAAGSAIAEDVPDDALALERSGQVNKDGWAARRRAQRSGAAWPEPSEPEPAPQQPLSTPAAPDASMRVTGPAEPSAVPTSAASPGPSAGAAGASQTPVWVYVDAPAVMMGVDDTSSQIGHALPGQWYRLETEAGGWALVASTDGTRGWIASAAVRHQH